MLIEDEFEVAAPVESCWEYFLDVPRVSQCMPGADLSEVIDQDHFRGQMTASMGPVTLKFNGDAEIAERNQAERKVVIKASGAEAKGKGQAEMTVTARLYSAGAGTRVHVSQDLNLSGAAAQFGRGMISDVAGVLLKQFAQCASADLGAAERGEAAPSGAPGGGAQVKGITLGIQYATMTVKRFFERLLGTNFRNHDGSSRPLARQQQ